MSRAAAELHPLLAHHVVNSLGWPSLRPFQQRAVAPLVAGDHALLLAPTAGGKTEAAFFPVVSRMLAEDWRGLSVLYLCPLRALLNNLHPRLQGYSDLVGRGVGLWHGDVAESARARTRADPPDVLLTTPESIEAMLISSRTDHAWLFRNLRSVIVDEIHAFAGDDRGWHLLSVVQRVQRLAGRELQRVGLSATVGEPSALLDWFTTGVDGRKALIDGSGDASDAPEVIVDHVGSMGNAATVISRLHRGEKRLVFVDSRSRAEQLTDALRATGESVWLSHGSLGRDERGAAEEAFATAPAGVIVATSTMELGIDVGDLHRVIQIDAPWTVASFLQRLGRTGRRAGTTASCLLLTTRDQSLAPSLGVLHAWAAGYVEPVRPPPLPVHLAVQQLLALLRQEGALGRRVWREWLGDPCVLGQDVGRHLGDVVAFLVAAEVLSTDGPMLQLGPAGEARYGRRNFLDLTAVFADPPTLAVVNGHHVLGTIHVDALLRAPHDAPAVLLVGGRRWSLLGIDWRRRQVHVQPAKGGAALAAWSGGSPGMSAHLARATKHVLGGEDPAGVRLSRRAVTRLADVRAGFGWLDPDGPTHRVQDSAGAVWWWTFAGTTANEELGSRLGRPSAVGATSGLAVRSDDVDAETLRSLDPSADLRLPDDFEAAWKFADELPRHLQSALWNARGRDRRAVSDAVTAPLREVMLNRPGPRP